jgi:hypothetical protein
VTTLSVGSVRRPTEPADPAERAACCTETRCEACADRLSLDREASFLIAAGVMAMTLGSALLAFLAIQVA